MVEMVGSENSGEQVGSGTGGFCLAKKGCVMAGIELKMQCSVGGRLQFQKLTFCSKGRRSPLAVTILETNFLSGGSVTLAVSIPKVDHSVRFSGQPTAASPQVTKS